MGGHLQAARHVTRLYGSSQRHVCYLWKTWLV